MNDMAIQINNLKLKSKTFEGKKLLWIEDEEEKTLWFCSYTLADGNDILQMAIEFAEKNAKEV